MAKKTKQNQKNNQRNIGMDFDAIDRKLNKHKKIELKNQKIDQYFHGLIEDNDAFFYEDNIDDENDRYLYCNQLR